MSCQNYRTVECAQSLENICAEKGFKDGECFLWRTAVINDNNKDTANILDQSMNKYCSNNGRMSAECKCINFPKDNPDICTNEQCTSRGFNLPGQTLRFTQPNPYQCWYNYCFQPENSMLKRTVDKTVKCSPFCFQSSKDTNIELPTSKKDILLASNVFRCGDYSLTNGISVPNTIELAGNTAKFEMTNMGTTPILYKTESGNQGILDGLASVTITEKIQPSRRAVFIETMTSDGNTKAYTIMIKKNEISMIPFVLNVILILTITWFILNY